MAEARIGPELRAKIKAAWPVICAAVAEGGHVGNTYAAHGITRGQAAAFLAGDPDAREQWEEAREQSADSFFDQAQEIASNPGVDSKSARVKLDALRWLAGKRNPRYYGDKSTLDVNVKTIDLTRTIAEANARLAQASRPALRDVSDAELVVPLLAGSKPDLF